jgi:hypothetical protein
MEKQYVYIGRLINHKNEFIDGYYKLGKTKHYTIRETQLNSTHLPIDVLLERVFETDDMVRTESLLQTCFEDYRVIKKYDDKKDKRTEWFFVDDEEKLHSRIDKIVGLFKDIKEVDLINDIQKDVETTKEEKQELIKTFRKAKSRLGLMYMGKDISQETSTDTFLLCLKKISEQSSWEQILENETRVTKTLVELRDRNPSADSSQLKPYEGYVVFTGNNNEVKVKIIGKLIKKLNINDLHLSVKN